MANTIKIFGARRSPSGFREVEFFVRSSVLETGLASNEGIDGFVKELKKDLDVAVKEAKAFCRANAQKTHLRETHSPKDLMARYPSR